MTLKSVFACVLALLLAFPAFAKEDREGAVEMNYCSVNLPSNWRLLSKSDMGGLELIVFSTKSRDAIVTVLTGASMNSRQQQMAEIFASQYDAEGKIATTRNGTSSFTYTNFEKKDGIAWVSVAEGVYLFASAEGDVSAGKKFLKLFTSEPKYQTLLPLY